MAPLTQTNYQSILTQANQQMQQLMNISSSGNWEEILAAIQNAFQGQAYQQLPGAGKSIFNIEKSGEQLFSGDTNQKAAAFQNILNSLTDLLGNLGTKKSLEANKEVKKNDAEIRKNDMEASKLHQTLDSKLQDIMNQCTNGAKTIEDAIKEIEALGGDKGQIAQAQADLEQQLAVIEENKIILNNGVSSLEEKKQALVNILSAASAINSLVALVNDCKAQIEAKNAIVEQTSTDLADLTVNASEALGQGMQDMAQLMQNGQQLTVKTEAMSGKAIAETGAGETQIGIGQAMTSGVQAIATGSEGIKYIMSGNDKVNAGATLMSGSIQGLAQLTQSMGQMNSYLQYFANFCNGIGKFTEGAQELVGQYDATVNPMITAIGSWEQVNSANTELQTYLQEYTSNTDTKSESQNKWQPTLNIGFNNGKFSYKATNNLQDKQTEIEQSDASNMQFKEFTFDTNLFKVKQ